MQYYILIFPHLPITFFGILSLIIFSECYCDRGSRLIFFGTSHAYLLNTSISVRIYLNPLLKEEKACISTKSADYISSLLKTITDRLGNFLLTGFCNSSANFSVSFQLFIFYLNRVGAWCQLLV